MRRLLICLSVGFTVAACGGAGRVLIVKSEPADAEVCIKGKAKSEHFSNAKSCVGSTPFEADRVEVTDGNDHRTVKFKDVESDKESFYVVVSRQGYATQAVEVPGWEHFVQLKPEGVAAAIPPIVPSVLSIVPAAAPAAPLAKGSVHITSDPVGALVYINEALKGNTPFTYDGEPGPVRLKLELEGFHPLEKVLTVESGKAINVNFKLLTTQSAAMEAAKSKPVETAPLKLKDEAPADKEDSKTH